MLALTKQRHYIQASGVVGYEPEKKQRLGLKDEQL